MEMHAAEALIGQKVEVFQPGDNLWQTGRIERYYPDKGWWVQYYDGDATWLPSLENVEVMRNEEEIDEDSNGDDGDNGGNSDNGEERASEEQEELYEDEFEMSSPTKAEQDAMRDMIDGVDPDLNEFDEYLLSHPHGDETLRELAGLELSAGMHAVELVDRDESCKSGEEHADVAIDSDADEDGDLEHMPSEEHNAVIEIRIHEITDMVTLASGIRNPHVRILFAETPPDQENTKVDSAFRCKSLLFTSGTGMAADTNALEWSDESSNSFTFEAIMQDGPIEESLFGDLILALHGDTSTGNQQMVADTSIHLKDVLRNGESKIGATLARISMKTAVAMKQRASRKTTDGVIHFEIDVYFRRARLMMQHKPKIDPPKAATPRTAAFGRSVNRTNRKANTSKPAPTRSFDPVAVQRRNAMAKRQRDQAALQLQNERHQAKLNNTRSHIARLIGKPTKPATKVKDRGSVATGSRSSRNLAQRPAPKPIILEESVKAAFADPTALMACIVGLRKSVSDLEELTRFTRIKLQKQETLNEKKRRQISQQGSVAATNNAGRSESPPSSSTPRSSQMDGDTLGHDDLEFQELKATNDAFNSTRQQLAQKIELSKRQYDSASQTYDRQVAQLKVAKKRIKRMMNNKTRRDANNHTSVTNGFDGDSGSDDESQFSRLHQQYVALQAEIDALAQFKDLSANSPSHELNALQATAERLRTQLTMAQQGLADAKSQLEHYQTKNEEYNRTQVYEKWRKCVAAMRVITTKCDREERLHAITKQIEEVDPGVYR